ncbi:MAG: FHA domain-containing protein [Thermodesulfobacteriota bacterium]
MKQWSVMLQDKVIRTFAIEDGERLIIGRGDDANIRIDNPAISRHHAALEIQNGKPYIQDLCSLNGTKVNGKAVDFIQISESDTINLGKFTLISGTPENSRTTLSSAGAPMDLEDATIFTPGKKPAQPEKKEGIGPLLQVASGNGSPGKLLLKGRNSVKIGKDANSDIVITGLFIAASQCYISLRDNGYHLIPQKSWRKTKVNNITIQSPYKLKDGDQIVMGKHCLRFIVD